MAADSASKPTYTQIRDSLKTGDLLSFQGESNLLDWMIQWREGEPYTHVGMVVRDGDDLYFWDAPGGGEQFPDPYRGGQKHAGCRVANLDDLLAYYMAPDGGEVALYWRQLSPALTAEQEAMCHTFIDLADGMAFPGDDVPKELEMLGLGAGLIFSSSLGRTFKATIAGNFFCAHLVAETYMRMGLLPIAPWPSNSYSPANMDSSDPTKLPLRNCSLTKTQELAYP